MRIAIISDIHGNLTAFKAVLADLKLTSPDVIFHGGDLADAGSSPAEVVDLVRELEWPGVVGNTDEMLYRPEAFQEFARQSSGMQALLPVIEEMAEVTRGLLGEERIVWLSQLPRIQIHEPMALVHASPESLWRAPGPEASDAELESVFGALSEAIAVYAHIHRPFIRRIASRLVVNTGSVSLSYDGDWRAAYLLLDLTDSGTDSDYAATHRRVEYDLDTELRALASVHIPHADWVARILKSARPQMP